MLRVTISRGRPLPLGTSTTPDGVNFAILSRHATIVTLVVFAESGGGPPLVELTLDGKLHRTGDHWHLTVADLPPAFSYCWRIDGPRGDKNRFDPTRLLIDPCSTALANTSTWAGTCEVDPERTSRRTLYVAPKPYDWGQDSPLRIPPQDSVIYEIHVRGFTQHRSSHAIKPGTYRGLIEKIPYLQWLGVTTVELLPVFEFDECDCPFSDPTTGVKHVNYWGYNPIAFVAPKASFASGEDPTTEFRDMVKAFHEAGLEVVLDVVFNHTGEGDERGRSYHFRGIDNELYYLTDSRGNYLNYSGCGNTVNCNHPTVRELILASLRYWVTEMHVDGFRFDLASILGRDRQGQLMANPPAIEMIADDGVLWGTKLIAEPWDAGGAYQVGEFPSGDRWAEWNDRFRDDVRRFWCGEPGLTGQLANRLCGSSDIFGRGGRRPTHSINFITSHDGFTLHDLVSYNDKHNLANGEENRDGHNDNCSWNSGEEGPTDDPWVLELRRRRAKSIITTLMLSQGMPMILGGDEFLRTQLGNNNAWCQDNTLSWLDWSQAEHQAGFHRFVRELIWLRRRHPVFRRSTYYHGQIGPHQADIRWHGLLPNEPDFSKEAVFLAFTLDGRFHDRAGELIDPDQDFYVAMNGHDEALTCVVPPSPTGRAWRKIIDTAALSPLDFVLGETDTPEIVAGSKCRVEAFAVVVLMTSA